MAKFLEIFNDLLSENGLNRKQFAELSGIPYTTVIGWTNLNRLPDYTALIKIADYFKCSVDYLAGRQEQYADSNLMSLKKSESRLISHYRALGEENKKLLLYDDFGCWDKVRFIGTVCKETIAQMPKVN